MAKYVPIEGQIKDSDVQRFRMKTQPGSNGCIEWIAATGGPGSRGHNIKYPETKGLYGYFWFNGRQVRAHRFALYMLDEIDPGESVEHDCNNTLCVNFKHLRSVTHAQNNATKGDVSSAYCKNGHLKKEPNGYYRYDNHWYCLLCHREYDKKRYMTRYKKQKELKTHSSEMRDFARDPKLNEEIVKQIRLDYLGEIKSQRKLAIKYNISQPMVGFIVRNESWHDSNYIPGVGFKD